MTTIFTQNDNFNHFQRKICAFDQLVTKFIFFTAWDRSRVQWDSFRNSTQKMRSIFQIGCWPQRKHLLEDNRFLYFELPNNHAANSPFSQKERIKSWMHTPGPLIMRFLGLWKIHISEFRNKLMLIYSTSATYYSLSTNFRTKWIVRTSWMNSH